MLHIILELAIVVGACLMIAEIAFVDFRSPLRWAGITLGLCLLALLIPVPYMRFVAAGMAAFLAMFVCNLVQPPRL